MLKSTLKLLLVMQIAAPCSLLAMDKAGGFRKTAGELRALELEADMAEATKELQEVNREMAALPRERYLEEVRDAKIEAEAKAERIRWQNTRIGTWKIFGLYKRDLPEFIKVAGDLGADILMQRNLLKRREATIEAYIKDHLAEFIAVLESAKKAQETVEQVHAAMSRVSASAHFKTTAGIYYSEFSSSLY